MPDTSNQTTLDLSRPFFLIRLERNGGETKYSWSPNIFLKDESDEEFSIQKNTYVTHIAMNSSFDQATNQCEIWLNRMAGTPLDIITGDRIQVFLGYYKMSPRSATAFAKVFTGVVAETEMKIIECRVLVLGSMHELINSHKNLVLNRDTIDQAIARLVEDVEGVEVNEISSCDIQKSRYILSNRETLYNIISQLSIQSGMDLYMDVHDKLVVKTWDPESAEPGELHLESVYSDTLDESSTKQYIHNFYLGLNVIDMEVRQLPLTVKLIEVKSFSNYGEEDENILSIEHSNTTTAPEEEDTNKAGKHLIIQLPFTPAESVKKISENLLAHYNAKLGLHLFTTGSPHIRLGDGLRVAGKLYGQFPFPDIVTSPTSWDSRGEEDEVAEDDGKGKIFQVNGIEHLFSMKDGFTTRISLVEREPPEKEGQEEEDDTGEEGEVGIQEDGEDHGESIIAPEYLEVAKSEARAIMDSQKEFMYSLQKLMNTAMELDTEKSRIAEEYIEMIPKQKDELMGALDGFSSRLSELGDITGNFTKKAKEKKEWYKKGQK